MIELIGSSAFKDRFYVYNKEDYERLKAPCGMIQKQDGKFYYFGVNNRFNRTFSDKADIGPYGTLEQIKAALMVLL